MILPTDLPRGLLPILAVAAGLTLPGVPSAEAQDVELLGRMYGTSVPRAYYARTVGPDAFEFGRAFRGREGLLLARSGGGDPRLRGALEGAALSNHVSGRFNVPVVLGFYGDSPAVPVYDAATVQAHFFDGPNNTGTISQYYAAASRGRVDLVGTVFDWQQVSLDQAQVAGGSSGLGGGSRVAEYIAEIVVQLDSLAVDWGPFDNDGPDGVPNSGDDDGFVDVLAVLHPTEGAECGGNRMDDKIWSHRWAISPQLGAAFVTRTPSASGGFIRIDDYTIQPVLACGSETINQIGVFAHELGHGFGLPDLYAVGADHPAVGQWDLMAAGSWGCPGVFNPSRPCMLGAWSRATLGWMTVLTLDFGVDHGVVTLHPVGSGGATYRVNTQGDDYYLLENRQPEGFDSEFPDGRGGLLVWHVDADGVNSRRWSNSINSDANNQGIRVVQADGKDQLSQIGEGRGDAGDPFPGLDVNTVFHAGSTPASFTNEGVATGVTLLDIQAVGSTIRTRILARFQQLSVNATGAPMNTGWVRVDNGSLLSSGAVIASAPYQQHVFEAEPGVPLTPGVRLGFQAWQDGADRSRTVTTGEVDAQFNATYSGRQVELNVGLESDEPAVTPGTLVTQPAGDEGWYAEGTTVTVEARPRTGFAFRDWSGALSGSSNPTTVTLDAPTQARARFDVTFEPNPVAPRVSTEGGQTVEIVLEAENANVPIVWTLVSGALPEGLELRPAGSIVGVPLQPGTFPLRVEVIDGIGLQGALNFEISVAPPSIAPDVVAGAFTGETAGPTLGQKAYLDAQGNTNGIFDLGDLRAFLQGAPAGLIAVPEDGARLSLPRVRLSRGGGP